jgi:hypothetical protein
VSSFIENQSLQKTNGNLPCDTFDRLDLGSRMGIIALAECKNHP